LQRRATGIRHELQAESRRNLRTQPARVDDRTAHAGLRQGLHVVLQQRLALHLQQGLGGGVGQRPHALATACGQQHGRRLFGEGKRLGGGERRDGLGGHGGQL
jgi:hypothetical protein